MKRGDKIFWGVLQTLIASGIIASIVILSNLRRDVAVLQVQVNQLQEQRYAVK